MSHSIAKARGWRIALGALALLPVGLTVATTACLHHHDCPVAGVTSCDPNYPNSYTICSTNEDTSTTLYRYPCSTGVTCDPKVGRCAPKELGEPCSADNNCNPTLRCESGVCLGPTAEETARCTSAPVLVDVPAPGASVEVEVPVDDELKPTVQRMMRRDCDAKDASVSRFGRAGFLRLNPGRTSLLTIAVLGDTNQVALIAVLENCVAIYGAGAFLNRCASHYPEEISGGIGAPEALLLVALTSDSGATSVRLRLGTGAN